MTKDEIDSGRKYAAQRFGIPLKEIVYFNSGCCYGVITTTSLSAAKKVAVSVKGQTCNGGWYDGMALGNIHRSGKNYDTMC